MDPVPSSSAKFKPADWLLLACCVLIPAVFYAVLPLFRAGGQLSAFYILTSSWNDESGYNHGWFIIPAMLAITWKNWPQIKKEPRSSSRWGLLLVAFALLLFVIGVRTILWRIAIGGIPILIYGMLLYLWGPRRANYFLFPLGLFYFCSGSLAEIYRQQCKNLEILVFGFFFFFFAIKTAKSRKIAKVY